MGEASVSARTPTTESTLRHELETEKEVSASYVRALNQSAVSYGKLKASLDRLYRAVLATTDARVADPHPDATDDIELRDAICEAERALGIA